MAKNWRKAISVAVCAALATSFVAAAAACAPDDGDGNGTVTYRTYTTTMPSNWNELTYSDNNDTQIMDYIGSPFFEYDYDFGDEGKFNADGSINKDAIVPGGFTVKYSAATALEDVTSSVDAKWGYTAEQKEAGGYAWKITLREDLKWDDGTPIDANDFVYTMKEQLNPDFFNLRANLYYNSTPIKNARSYLYGGRLGTVTPIVSEEDAGDEDAYITIAQLGTDEDGFYTYTVDDVEYALLLDPNDGGNWGASLADYGGDTFFADYKDSITGLVHLNEESLGVLMDVIAMLHDFDDADAYAAEVGDYAYQEWEEMAYLGKVFETMDFSEVGLYAPSKYELVICMDRPIMCLKEDGSLSYLAAYNFQSLPLVKKDLYEDCKHEPQAGSELWTTIYNTSRATTASWGPYKLTSFQSGKSYTVERNENWYGYGLEDNKGQYNIDAFHCEKIAEVNTQWMGFLAGTLDDIGLDVDHKEDYRNSKYTRFAPGTGTFGINLYAGLDALKTNGHNAGLLAIKDFREAISLWLDRDEYNQALYTSHQSCYGLLGPSYYYDVENGGVYRDTQQAKETLLSVYGFEKNADGKWTDGNTVYDDYEEAYEAMNGMNHTRATELVKSAYEELTTRADYYGYDPDEDITFVYGTSADNANTRRSYKYLVAMIADLVEGTGLEGKIKVEFDASFGANWANDFRSGAYEIAAGTGFSGGAFDPEGFLQCYVDPAAGLMYSTWWDTNGESFTYTMPAADVYGEYDEAGQEFTMSVLNWYACLNGIADTYGLSNRYNWGAGAIPEGARMELLAALEKLVLEKYYTIITTSEYSASLLGAKFSHFSDDYNIFMGFGGTRYMVVNYDDDAWDAYVSSQHNDLSTEYKKEN